MSRTALFASSLIFAACGGGTSPSGDDAPEPDASVSIDGSTSTLDPNDCAGFAANLVAAAQTCGTPVPANAQQVFEAACRKGVTSADLCGGDPAAGLACFETQDASDWVCAAGEPYPYCNNDLGAALGMYCLVSLGTTACASGIQCQFDADCSNGFECNEATGQCFSKDAYCVGLPCELDADCPTGHTCNGAEGACIIE